jgi:hypothetical protein
MELRCKKEISGFDINDICYGEVRDYAGFEVIFVRNEHTHQYFTYEEDSLLNWDYVFDYFDDIVTIRKRKLNGLD